jgi:hypothetical protein
MTATFDFNGFDELDSNFLKRLKSLYCGKNIKLTLAIQEEDFSMNELLERISDVEEGKNLVSFKEEEYQKVDD